MDNERKILALINPISGTLNKDSLPKSIDKIIDSEKFETEIKYTEHANHAYELSKEAAATATTEFLQLVVTERLTKLLLLYVIQKLL